MLKKLARWAKRKAEEPSEKPRGEANPRASMWLAFSLIEEGNVLAMRALVESCPELLRAKISKSKKRLGWPMVASLVLPKRGMDVHAGQTLAEVAYALESYDCLAALLAMQGRTGWEKGNAPEAETGV